ncbi:hypothetical protein V5799_026409 [Amblyomma americanum]|uniref:Uncharacterized protein n=1 Tax=Amblyomma americanum TaxID=6943 RepID=A0AAQ4DIN7_AMBAM
MILSSQNLAYAGSKFLCGVLSDSLSSRLMFAAGLLLSAGFTFVLAASSVSAYPFAALWFLNGCSQGCGWPSLIKVLQQVSEIIIASTAPVSPTSKKLCPVPKSA